MNPTLVGLLIFLTLIWIAGLIHDLVRKPSDPEGLIIAAIMSGLCGLAYVWHFTHLY